MGNEEIVELLLQYDAQPDLKDKVGKTPLSRAIETGNVAVANCLKGLSGNWTLLKNTCAFAEVSNRDVFPGCPLGRHLVNPIGCLCTHQRLSSLTMKIVPPNGVCLRVVIDMIDTIRYDIDIDGRYRRYRRYGCTVRMYGHSLWEIKIIPKNKVPIVLRHCWSYIDIGSLHSINCARQ